LGLEKKVCDMGVVDYNVSQTSFVIEYLYYIDANLCWRFGKMKEEEEAYGSFRATCPL
jgi:hypothetical protein